MEKSRALYIRSVIFGLTDSLVSTVGLLAGLAVANASVRTLLATGVIYAFVEAFSMAVGDYLSEESAEEFVTKREAAGRPQFFSGVIMFAVCVLASLVPIAPYLFLARWTGLFVSVAVSIVLLFAAGMVSAALARVSLIRHGLQMAVLGGSAIVIGVAVGFVLPNL